MSNVYTELTHQSVSISLMVQIWHEEIFGPVLCVKTFEDDAEAIALANDSQYGLAGAVFS